MMHSSLECNLDYCFFWLYTDEHGHKYAGGGSIKNNRAKSIKAPKIYWDYTCTTILTMEWLDGIKLTDETGLSKASLNRRELIDQV